MVYMEPKYHESTALYRRSRASGSAPWEPGELCLLPSDVVPELPNGSVIDMQAVLMGIQSVENQVFDIMGGKSY